MNLWHRFKIWSQPYRLKAQFFYEHKLSKKRYLALVFALSYLPFFFYYTSQSSPQATLRISKFAEELGQKQIPLSLRKPLFGAYSYYYNVNRAEMLKDFNEYKTFSDFFTRRIKKRQIYSSQNIKKSQVQILSPSDSCILSFGQIIEDKVFAIKGYNYSLGQLLTGQKSVSFNKEDIDRLKRSKQNKLYHVILYLAPGDYHRFHSSIDFQIMKRKVIDGALFSVNQKNLIKNQKVYEKNSRLILHGKWKEGYFGMVLIGAFNVGRIIVKQKLKFQKGQEIGYFNLGSTIILLIQSPSLDWKIKQKQKVKYGQLICEASSKSSTTKII